jgi:hypothetical protein
MNSKFLIRLSMDIIQNEGKGSITSFSAQTLAPYDFIDSEVACKTVWAKLGADLGMQMINHGEIELDELS